MIITSEPASTEIHKSYLKEEESTKQKNTALTKNKKRVLVAKLLQIRITPPLSFFSQ